MAHDRSSDVNKAINQAVEKYDYFLLTLAGALTAYVGKDLVLVPLGWNASTVALASVVCFAGSMFAGIRKLALEISLMRANYDQLFSGEAAGALADTAQTHKLSLNVQTGHVITATEALAYATQFKQRANMAAEAVSEFANRVPLRQRLRNGLLYSGVVLLLASRVLHGYGLI